MTIRYYWEPFSQNSRVNDSFSLENKVGELFTLVLLGERPDYIQIYEHYYVAQTELDRNSKWSGRFADQPLVTTEDLDVMLQRNGYQPVDNKCLILT